MRVSVTTSCKPVANSLPPDDRKLRDGIFAFGHHRLPMLRRGLTQLDADNPIVLRLVVGQDIQVVPVISRNEAAVDAVNDRPDRRLGRPQVLYININPLRRHTVVDVDQQVAPILARVAGDQLQRPEVLAVEGLAEDALIG